MKFLDQVKVYIRSGDGGRGCVAFHRAKCIAYGGPNGGDGGRGGDVVVVAVDAMNTLIDFRYKQHFHAECGDSGRGANRSGRKGRNAVLRVPIGTQVFDEYHAVLLADLIRLEQSVVLARGGAGGFGNAHYRTATNRAPRYAGPGWPGEERWLWLRLKLLADIGLIGLPNAGKSTFLATVTHAKPKIAPYPFTTLYPHLGVTHVDGEKFVLADIPGLIEGAHNGAGLGFRFLGHVERCSVLLHIVDGTGDVKTSYRVARGELESYGHGLDRKIEIVALNKVDSLSTRLMTEKHAALANAAGVDKRTVRLVSGASGYGVDVVLQTLKQAIMLPQTPAAQAMGKWTP